jgi:hypothetical protein
MKNRTSAVPSWRTVARIEELLAKAGATNVMKQFAPGGKLVALAFQVTMPDQTVHTVRLPAKIDAVARVMKSAVKKPHKDTIRRIEEQAERTAWKLQQDWVEVQISMIEMGQVEFLQVFMPYLAVGKTSFYDHFLANQQRMLGAGREKSAAV